ncbi:MAG: transporter substrate-binding domain-containing protein [Firmicutes bacterium]|nr:transporter substrate-binding domain-containing protein [Bacillota bacterium]
MKRIIAAAVVLLLCLTAVSCRNRAGAESTVSDPSWSKISEEKRLVVGVYSDRAPLASPAAENGFEGFDIDLLTQLAARLNVTASFVAIDGRSAEEALTSGEVDCVCSGFAYSTEHDEALSLSDVYLTARQIFAVRTESEVENLADLAGKTLGIVSGSTADLALQQSETFRAALAEVKAYPSEQDVMHALLGGEIDAAAVNELLVRNYIVSGFDLRTLLGSDNTPDSLGSEDYVLAFRRGSDSLLKKVQEAFSTMMRDGVLDELAEKWFSNYLSSEEQKAADEIAEQTASAADAESEELTGGDMTGEDPSGSAASGADVGSSTD